MAFLFAAVVALKQASARELHDQVVFGLGLMMTQEMTKLAKRGLRS
jgi:hypothetical protein